MESFNALEVTGVFLFLVQVICFITGLILTMKSNPFSKTYDLGKYLLLSAVVIGPFAIFLL